MKIFYNLIFFAFGMFYLPFFVFRLRQEKDKKRLLSERFGFFSQDFLERLQDRKVLWIHAVSVGEVFAARPLIEKLQRDLPDWVIAVSTVTPTGQAIAKKLFEDLPVFYFPFDLSGAVKRALTCVHPTLILLMETEIWPNLILGAWDANIPVGIVNGRLSPKSYRRYKQVRSVFKGILDKISFFLVQFQWDSDRLQEIGVDASRILVTGNMKFDANSDLLQEELKRFKSQFSWRDKDKVLLAGSTHAGEEKILIGVFRKLRFEFPDLRLVLAPRHVNRSGTISRLVQENGFRCQLASSINGSSIDDVLIIDGMGELRKWYAVADFVFMGGSLVKHGGQNPIEAAVLKKPILFGPHIFNFQLVYDKMLEEKAGFQVYNETELHGFLRTVLLDPSLAKEMGAKAFALIQKLRGATQRNMEFIKSFLNRKESILEKVSVG